MLVSDLVARAARATVRDARRRVSTTQPDALVRGGRAPRALRGSRDCDCRMDSLAGLVAWLLRRLRRAFRGRDFSVNGRALFIERLLGEGGLGKVFAVSSAEGALYALKELRAPAADVAREVSAHRAVASAHVVPLLDYARLSGDSAPTPVGGVASSAVEDEHALLLFPLWPSGTLAALISARLGGGGGGGMPDVFAAWLARIAREAGQ